MRAVVCTSFAPLDQLVIEERPSAPLAAGQVRVRVTAAGVNFVDALLVQGLDQIKPPLPFVPGGETVGIVTELGEGVTSHSLGDRVLITSGFGGFATEMVSAASRAVIVQSSLTDGQAATFMQSYMTAYFALVHRAKMHGGGANNVVKQYVNGSVCPACHCDFRTRARLVQHLRPRPDAPCLCRAFALSGAVPLLSAAAAAVAVVAAAATDR